MKGWSPGSPQQLQEEEEEHLWWSHRNSIPDPRMENGASLCYTRRRPKHYRSAYTCIHTNATVCRKSHLLTTNRCENKSLQPCWPVYTQQFIRLRRNKTSRTCSLIDSKVVTTIRPIPNTCMQRRRGFKTLGTESCTVFPQAHFSDKKIKEHFSTG